MLQYTTTIYYTQVLNRIMRIFCGRFVELASLYRMVPQVCQENKNTLIHLEIRKMECWVPQGDVLFNYIIRAPAYTATQKYFLRICWRF
ncbi:unnamed protein product [Cylicocyclus nassatus]|uniref:Uncharacterized protein n=1 Tax=Cylicocyclus nassatus TaxID=53992 RepID=A0AA36HGV1_CYLNA|nr:unnamed protein product [Cylicocyclus nassatus]